MIVKFEDKVPLGISIVFLLKKKTDIDEVDFYQVKKDMQKILEKI